MAVSEIHVWCWRQVKGNWNAQPEVIDSLWWVMFGKYELCHNGSGIFFGSSQNLAVLIKSSGTPQ